MRTFDDSNKAKIHELSVSEKMLKQEMEKKYNRHGSQSSKNTRNLPPACPTFNNT
jgi:hypothetical protein